MEVSRVFGHYFSTLFFKRGSRVESALKPPDMSPLKLDRAQQQQRPERLQILNAPTVYEKPHQCKRACTSHSRLQLPFFQRSFCRRNRED